jgi:hypothetical protein
MIEETQTSKGTPAITSDHWHVVHSHYTGQGKSGSFARVIVSEHDDRKSCSLAATALLSKLASDAKASPRARRDEVFARPPNYKSLKARRRRVERA